MRFEALAGSALADDLSVLARSWVEDQDLPENADAKAVLRKLRPSSMAEVGRAELQHESPAVRRAGMWTSLMADDREAAPLLRGLVVREDAMSTPVDRQETQSAVEALAGLGANQEVVDAVLRWGLDVAEDARTERRTQPMFSDEIFAPVFPALASRDLDARGRAALVIGISGRQDLASQVRLVLASAPPDSTAARDAIIALYWLGDRDPDTAPTMRRQLEAGFHLIAVIRYLLRAGTSEATRLLIDYLERAIPPLSEPQLFVAANLARNAETRKLAAERIWAHIQQPKRILEDSDLLVLLAELDDDTARQHVHREAFPLEVPGFAFLGTKESAIRALARYDPKRAFSAAEFGLKQGLHYAEDMPFLLDELDSARAVPLLFDHLPIERRLAVRLAIARVLRRSTFTDKVRESTLAMLAHSSAQVRRVGAELAGELRGDFQPELRRLWMSDPSREVRHASQQAVLQQRRQALALELLRALADAPATRRWALLDAFLDVANTRHIADSHDPLWLWRVIGDMPEVLNRHARKLRKEKLDRIRDAVRRVDRELE